MAAHSPLYQRLLAAATAIRSQNNFDAVVYILGLAALNADQTVSDCRLPDWEWDGIFRGTLATILSDQRGYDAPGRIINHHVVNFFTKRGIVY